MRMVQSFRNIKARATRVQRSVCARPDPTRCVCVSNRRVRRSSPFDLRDRVNRYSAHARDRSDTLTEREGKMFGQIRVQKRAHTRTTHTLAVQNQASSSVAAIVLAKKSTTHTHICTMHPLTRCEKPRDADRHSWPMRICIFIPSRAHFGHTVFGVPIVRAYVCACVCALRKRARTRKKGNV